MFFTFFVLLKNYFRYIDLVIELLLPANLQHDNVSGEPNDTVLARERVRRVLIAIAVDVMLHLLQLLHDDLLRVIGR